MDLVPKRVNGRLVGYRREEGGGGDVVPFGLRKEYGDHVGRARAFEIVTLNLSVVTGLGFVVLAAVMRDSLTLGVVSGFFFAGFVMAWLISYMMYVVVSAEGIDLLQVILAWRHLEKERRERWEYYRSRMPDSR